MSAQSLEVTEDIKSQEDGAKKDKAVAMAARLMAPTFRHTSTHSRVPSMFAANIPPLLKQLWAEFDFNPNPAQRDAILHTNGPLFLPAGPGSGKTRVLLWRAVNLIAVQGVPPECVFLSTFTEKAAF